MPAPSATLSPSQQWQAVKHDEWWKTDAIKDDPQWWAREREALGGGAQSPTNGAGNGTGGAAAPAGNGVVNAGAVGEESLGSVVKREAQFAVDSAMARLMAMRLALTRPARQRAFEKEVQELRG